jgi:hypothetical protein
MRMLKLQSLSSHLKRFVKVPQSKVGQFVFAFVVEFISFFIIVANTRALAQGSYLWTGVTDFGFGIQAFAIGKLMIDNKECRTWAFGLGSTAGGTCGSLFSIFITKHLYGA